MNPYPESQSAVDTLRIGDAEWLTLVSHLDRASARIRVSEETRTDERLPYRNLASVLLAVAPPDPQNEWARFRVRPRDISTGGFGFLHGSYLHPGSPCLAVLGAHGQGLVTLKGRIARCEFLRGKLHQVGIQFDLPIDVEQFLTYLPE
ncbi:MAG: PilZ domain-containing protein [Planctomycetota bacterium]